MNDNFIRNREGRIIGRIDGDWLRDGTGKLVARYDNWDNRTRDASGKIVGSGDQRMKELGKTSVGQHLS
jgi:YD repeat-containing protein